MNGTPDLLAVNVRDLRYQFASGATEALENCTLQLAPGSRCLLIGANGAGKSTLLRLLAGKRLADANIQVFGQDVFRSPPHGITYLGTEWAMNPVVRSDITVSHFLDSVGGFRHADRRDRLLDLLDVDLSWRMHAISDGERRRVQLCMGLMEPFRLLLLDEVTVDLDVQVRCDLLEFLKEESIQRGAAIVYATHIFDGIHTFPTEIVHLRLGHTVPNRSIPWPLPMLDSMHPEVRAALPSALRSSEPANVSRLQSISLLELALAWLREDRVLRTEQEQSRGIKRGRAPRDAHSETTDAKKFFNQYDYYDNYTR
ncbi:CCR4-NOT regulatory complex component [Malassezia yamatoensis]|uniref:CCR4-NOT regulatory complex component n=1 Tax=Malassezia yamatoensis TaxID=253288 RepID=A0AAJ5YVV9_9BASI|nr:CCR4-NOT regulatory complex component [Malassezia yamatoensis]